MALRPRVTLVLLALTAFVILCAAQGSDNPIYPADKCIKLVRKIKNAALYHINAPAPQFADVNIPVLHVWGTSEERGYAHGYIYADEIMDFMQNQMPPAVLVAVTALLEPIPNSNLPNYLKELMIGSALDIIPPMAQGFFDFIVKAQTPFLNATENANTLIEMSAMAQGICDNWKSRGKACDLSKVTNLVLALNLFPDLVRMSCSMFGSWGEANDPSNPDLIQMRALDFGAGPFPNASMIVVQHPTEQGRNPFVALSFPGFAAVVTGVSNKIALSEKVWLTYDKTSSKPTAYQEGSYYGEADVMVMRRMLEYANNIDEAIDMAANANRTWGIWLGVGQKQASAKYGVPMEVLQYRRADVTAYDDKTLPQANQGIYMPGVVYVDKHPQPSKSQLLGQLLQQQHGKITAEWAVKNIPRITQSGDVHIAFYDFNKNELYVSTGVTDATWNYPKTGGGQAYSRPFIRFSLTDLFNTPRP